MSKLIVEITDDLHRILKQRAVREGRTLRSLVVDALHGHMQAQPDFKEWTERVCGAWADERSAGEIVSDIRRHRQHLIRL